jgi:hypothetical protein
VSRPLDPRWAQLAARVAAHPRHPGYYVVGCISIEDLPGAAGRGPGGVAALAAAHFDDQPWAVPPSTLGDVSETTAREFLVDHLCGGPRFGHTTFTIEPRLAAELWQDFCGVFAAGCRFYVVELGDREFPFQGGVLIVGEQLVGVVNVVQGD